MDLYEEPLDLIPWELKLGTKDIIIKFDFNMHVRSANWHSIS